LSGDKIANKALAKINNRLKFLYRNTLHFELDIKKLLVSALIQCHFDYASSSWFSGLSKFSTSQNKVVRYLLGLPPRSHIGIQELYSVNLLPVETRVEQLKLNQMYTIINHTAPSYLDAKMVRDQHSISTRASRYSVVIPPGGRVGKSTFANSASIVWNSLPAAIQAIENRPAFKRSVKEFLWNHIRDLDDDVFIFY
jgi:hypothetical protein